MMSVMMVKKLSERIYRFREYGGRDDVDAFLLIGEKKAVMIDGLMESEGLLEQARKLTNLPLEMIVAHAHPDHAGQGCTEFIEAGLPVYMMKEDYPLLALIGANWPEDVFTWLQDGQVLDLGDVTLKVMAVPGHTQGSCILYCQEEQVVFSSDSLGSGDIWMWLPHSTPLREYQKNLVPVLDFLRQHSALRIYPGHVEQIPDYRGDGEGYLDLAYVEDLLKVTTDLVEGKKKGHPLEHPIDIMEGIDVRLAAGKIMRGYVFDSAKV